jgi:hypothetical protein
MKLDDALVPKIAQDAIDVNARQTHRVADIFLCNREKHFFSVEPWPSHSSPDEKLEEQMGDALACGATTDVR